jgi:hypothetical protein
MAGEKQDEPMLRRLLDRDRGLCSQIGSFVVRCRILDVRILRDSVLLFLIAGWKQAYDAVSTCTSARKQALQEVKPVVSRFGRELKRRTARDDEVDPTKSMLRNGVFYDQQPLRNLYEDFSRVRLVTAAGARRSVRSGASKGSSADWTLECRL